MSIVVVTMHEKTILGKRGGGQITQFHLENAHGGVTGGIQWQGWWGGGWFRG